MDDRAGLTYRDSGVDIDKANRAKERIKELAQSTFSGSVASEIGSFAGLFRPDFAGLGSPLLVASADGVGTKLKIAFLTGIHNTVGIDIVSHCSNDILVQGARPLFFLDYLATGKLEPDVVTAVVEGVAAGCRQSGCALLGGETAEMPDFYKAGEYDLAGFIVGAADEEHLPGPARVTVGDVLVGLPSSGLHTNGFSLVRRLFFAQEGLTVDDHVVELGRTLGEELLEPHRNYCEAVTPLLEDSRLHAMAHITGGGITENLDRALPPECDALVGRHWSVPAIFQLIQQRGRVQTEEMYRTFNMGIGLILVVDRRAADEVRETLSATGHKSFLIGEIVAGSGRVRYQ